jgi:hypothetical protein
MAFFVEQSNSKSKDDEQIERLDITLIAIGKRTGLTMAEMNELRVKDLLDYTKVYMGEKENKPREATQEDIDRFYA